MLVISGSLLNNGYVSIWGILAKLYWAQYNGITLKKRLSH